ncbi:NAD(P)/FAD-dependent oxidoreductase [Aliikangiella coralliicola]|uniref:NAD(P)/FAD-dependent oxidoreductase n=1 Tax=Aliikangiella coralliicola TaxID=2592383 RepID=A0A545UEJ4_9GAMM|nr:NAD(P)/FAD-dependent oxidoreductase [Aliikangiella coralliicola]TQV87855.1 NAD(P)/FAD-dependent oxidoreductase [Aliikangiella coralliicola]
MTQLKKETVDVLVIGAGPAGSLASALLKQNKINVLVLEKQKFPRFSIGESLLPQLMSFLEKADMREVVDEARYQFKDGAAFRKNGVYSEFNFNQKYSEGPGTTYQVKRADFDKRLADRAEELGVEIRYQHEVCSIEEKDDYSEVVVKDSQGEAYEVKAGFVLDASGFGRVLPRLLDLEYPSDLPQRQSIFCHIRDGISDGDYDRNKILISVHPQDNDVWYWLIPFSDGTCSLGVVGKPEFFAELSGEPRDKLLSAVAAEPDLAKLLQRAEIITEVQQIKGYSANVKSLFGNNFALLGNAGEFLDPVFSSGVTIAFKSAELATSLLIKEKRGETVCWQKDYSDSLLKGVNTFRAFVNAWYDGRLQDIIFYQDSSQQVRKMICAILAGYAWDENNPYVAQPERRLNVLAEICKS